MIKKITLIVLFVTLGLSGIAGCGSGSSQTAKTSSIGSMNTSDGSMNSGFSNSVIGNSKQAAQIPSSTNETTANGTIPIADTQQRPMDSHKIIQTGNIFMESLKFDDSVSKTLDYVKSIGGYAESSNIQGQGIDSNNTARKRTAYFVFRVPSEKYTDFFTKMKGYGVVTSEESQGQDITDQYFDTEARLKSLKIQEERELALLQKAAKLSDILEIEKELNSVRYQIESYTGTLKKWDSLVSYATVKVTITEVDESNAVVPGKTEGLWARIAFSFTDSIKQLVELMENLVVLFVAMLPFLVVLGVIVIIGMFIRKKFKKWRSKQNEDEMH